VSEAASELSTFPFSTLSSGNNRPYIDLWTDALDLVFATRFSGSENAWNFIQKCQLFIFRIDSCRVAIDNLMVVTSLFWGLKLPEEERLKKNSTFYRWEKGRPRLQPRISARNASCVPHEL